MTDKETFRAALESLKSKRVDKKALVETVERLHEIRSVLRQEGYSHEELDVVAAQILRGGSHA